MTERPTGDGDGFTSTMTVEWIGPERARELLEGNRKNRTLRPTVVGQYAADMAAGRWKYTSDSIKISRTGELLDGQHRLWAIIAAEVEVEMLVVTGLDPESKVAIDTGRRRSFRDVLHMSDVPGDIASTVRWCWRYERGLLETQPKGSAVSNAVLLEWYRERTPEGLPSQLGISVQIGHRVARRLRIEPAIAAGVHYFCSLVDPEAANEFFTSLAEGTGLEEGSAILALRKWLERLGQRRDRASPLIYAAYVIKAVNYWREGYKPRVLVWRPTSELFPMIEWAQIDAEKAADAEWDAEKTDAADDDAEAYA